MKRDPVPPDDPRDRAIARVLRETRSNATGRRETSADGDTLEDCLDPERLAAWSQGMLRADDATAVERHLSSCARCQTMLAALVRAEPVLPARVLWWRRWEVRWLVPLATAATAVAIWIATPGQDPTPRVQPLEERQLATADPPAREPVQSPAASRTPPVPVAGAQEQPRALADRGRRESVATERESSSNRRADLERELLRKEQRRPVPAPLAAPSPATPAPPLQEKVAVMAEGLASRAAAAVIDVTSPKGPDRWRIQNARQVQYSNTTGERWENATVPGPAVLLAGSSPAPRVCWLVGRAGFVVSTTDGLTFARVPFIEAVDLTSVRATDADTASVTATDGRTFQTSDRGANWTRVP